VWIAPTTYSGLRVSGAVNIGNFEFLHICRIEPERDGGNVLRFQPQPAFKNLRGLPRNNYGDGPFCKFRIPNRYNLSGVYALSVAGSRKYIGECRNLSARVNAGYGNISPRNCFKGGQETNCRLNHLIYRAAVDGLAIDLWFHQTPNFKAVEHELLAIERPLWNRK
jgi:hypothetical protein